MKRGGPSHQGVGNPTSTSRRPTVPSPATFGVGRFATAVSPALNSQSGEVEVPVARSRKDGPGGNPYVDLRGIFSQPSRKVDRFSGQT